MLYKNAIIDYEKDLKYLEKVNRDQGKDLLANAKRDNKPYI